MSKKKSRRAYMIYECRHGWCLYEADPPTFYSSDDASRVLAFSRLTQLLWFLQRAAQRPLPTPPETEA